MRKSSSWILYFIINLFILIFLFTQGIRNPNFFIFISIILIAISSFLITNLGRLGIAFFILIYLFLSLFATSIGIPFKRDFILFLCSIFIGLDSFLIWKKRALFIYNFKRGKERLIEDINVKEQDIRELEKFNSALEKKLSKFSNLRGFSEGIGSSLNLEELLDFIVKKTMELINKGDVTLLYLLESNGELSLKSSFIASSNIKVKAKKGDICDNWVLRQRLPLIINDIYRDFRFDSEEVFKYGREFRSLISSPIIMRSRVCGVLRVDSRIDSDFTPDDLRLLGIISDLSAIAIENALLFEKTEKLAIYDGLTGLYLRHYFWDKFDSELKKALKTNSLLSLFMIDIDDFKFYNDKYGHIVGDLILKHITKIIKDIFSPPDIVARYGGEEFVCLLIGREKEETIKLAEKVRSSIVKQVPIIRRKKINVTVSIGVSFFPKDADFKEELVKIADERLYIAKQRGKNKIVYN